MSDMDAVVEDIDTDTHLYEPISVWTDYIDSEYRDRAPSWVTTDGKLMAQVGDTLFPTVSGHPGFARIYGEDSEVDRSGNDPDARLAYMDGKGVDVQVIFPTLGMTGFSGTVADEGLAVALSKAYNRYVGEFASADPRRLKTAMLAPVNHPAAAATEMARARREHGLTVMFLNPTPPGDSPWSSARFDPVWAAAQDLGITVVFHESTAGCPSNAVGINRYTSHWPMVYLCTHVVEVELALADLMLGGTLHRFPNLKIGAAEAHVSWLPGWLAILDQNFGEGTRIWSDEAGEFELDMKPSDYFRRQCFVSAFPEDALIGEAMSIGGEQNIVVCSDWPHPISEERTGLDMIQNRADLTATQKRAILVDNPRRFFCESGA
jgi:uncharacterized protein